MRFSGRTVIIPLGTAQGAKGRTAHVHASGAKPANEARLIPEIALLNDCRLYPAGAVALDAVRRLDLKTAGFAPGQWFGGPPPAAYVSVSNAPELYGLTPENSASAQLGLALAMLMYKCQTPARAAIATGALATDGLAGALAGRRDDVAVKPVGLLAQKFEAVGRLLSDYRGAALSSSLPLFFPQETETGEETAAAHAGALAALVASYRAQGLVLEPRPVSTLREAAAALGARRLPPSRTDRALATLLLAAPLLAGLAGSAHWWLGRPLPLSFGAIRLADGETVATPARAAPAPGGALEIAGLCRNDRGLPVYGAGDRLVLKVRAGEDGSDWLAGGYHFAIVTVSERSGVRVFPPQSWGGEPSDAGASVTLPIEAPAEESKVMVLAQRRRPFDTDTIRTLLIQAVEGRPPAERINAAVNSLARQAPGYLDYSFQTVEGKPECAEP